MEGSFLSKECSAGNNKSGVGQQGGVEDGVMWVVHAHLGHLKSEVFVFLFILHLVLSVGRFLNIFLGVVFETVT